MMMMIIIIIMIMLMMIVTHIDYTPVSVYQNNFLFFKDSAYFCYCAYVLRISRYSAGLTPVGGAY